MNIDELIKSDTTDDNRFANAFTEIKGQLETYEAKISDLEKTITEKESAITSLKASNFDLLNRVGKPNENIDSPKTKSIEEILLGE